MEELSSTGQVNMKVFRETWNIGKSKYVVSFHDGVKKHNDGSNFFDIRIFSSLVTLREFILELLANGYTRESMS